MCEAPADACEHPANIPTHGGNRASELISEFSHRIPAIRSLCIVLKLFLWEQGLNRPYSGGIASVTLMCMIIAYLRQPFVDSSSEADLGSLLLNFLDFFGNRFCYSTTGISMHAGFFARPPGDQAALFVDDPLRPGADIWKGAQPKFVAPSNVAASSFNISSVAVAFSHAHTRLLKKLHSTRNGEGATSVLSELLNLEQYTAAVATPATSE